MRAATWGAVLLLWTLAAAVAGEARAAPASKARARLSLEEVAIMLTASSEDEVRSALEAAASLPANDVLPMLFERVRGGLPPVLLDVALDTLTLLGDRAASPLLLELAMHRRSAVRIRALEALVQLNAPEASITCMRALADLEPAVRTQAAACLGTLQANGAFDKLLVALEREVEGAAEALGRVAASEQVPRLVALFGRFSLATLSPMLEPLLTRPEIAEAPQLRVIEAVQALGTDEARALLGALQPKLPREASPRVKGALAAAARKGASP